MSSDALLRKKMLAVLQQKIVPDLKSNSARQLVMAHLPLHVPDGITVRDLLHSPLEEADAKKIYPGGKQWNPMQMYAIPYP